MILQPKIRVQVTSIHPHLTGGEFVESKDFEIWDGTNAHNYYSAKLGTSDTTNTTMFIAWVEQRERGRE